MKTVHALLLFVLAVAPVGLAAAEAEPAPAEVEDPAAPPLPPGARRATWGEVAIINDSLHKVAESLSRWAYTEHRVVRDGKGRVKSEQVIRFDPSKTFSEQWAPVQINGKPPSSRDEAKYRRRGEECQKCRFTAAPPRLRWREPFRKRRRTIYKTVKLSGRRWTVIRENFPKT